MCRKQKLQRAGRHCYGSILISGTCYLATYGPFRCLWWVTVPWGDVGRVGWRHGCLSPKLLLLDLSVPGNGFVMKKMQIPAVRAHFVMPAGKKRSGMAVGIDLYGLGKLFQFMLAYTSVVPPLTWKEEFMMSLVIQKCTGENGKKTYREFDQILRELPRGDRRKSCFRKIKKAL